MRSPLRGATTACRGEMEDLLLVESRGPVRVVTLNNPRQLNVLTRPMVEGLHAMYSQAEKDPNCLCVVLRGAGEGRALCAGGDVRAVHDMRPAPGDPRRAHAPIEALEFFETEYKMNLFLSLMSKPHVALIDGVVMGGGCGVSINGRFRVATERTILAMPECGIGLVPDVGGTHFLSKMPGEAGTCMALTGRRVCGADARALGLATHVVRSADLDKLVDSLAEVLGEAGEGGAMTLVDAVDDCLRGWERGNAATELGAGDLATHRALVERWFAADTVEDIVAALSSSVFTSSSSSSEQLQQQQQQLARELLAAMQASSPTSMKVTLAALRLASPRCATTGPGVETPSQRPLSTLAECLRCELCMVAACLARDDFYEGVRARLVDKYKGAPPAWRPAELAGVSARDVRSFFAPETKEVEVVVRRFEEAVGLEAPGSKKVGTEGLSPRL